MKFWVIFLYILAGFMVHAEIFSWTDPDTGILMMFDSIEKMEAAKHKHHSGSDSSAEKKQFAEPVQKRTIEEEFADISEKFETVWVPEISRQFYKAVRLKQNWEKNPEIKDSVINDCKTLNDSCLEIPVQYNSKVVNLRDSLSEFLILSVKMIEGSSGTTPDLLLEKLYTESRNKVQRYLSIAQKKADLE